MTFNLKYDFLARWFAVEALNDAVGKQACLMLPTRSRLTSLRIPSRRDSGDR